MSSQEILKQYVCNAPPIEVDIVLRTCDREFRPVSRWTGNKQVTVIGCLKSLIQSAIYAKAHSNLNICLHWFDDDSSNETRNHILGLITTHWPGNVFKINSAVTGNGASYGACVDYAAANCKNLIYLLEDDYIHQSSALLEMTLSWTKFQQDLEQDVVLYPVDYGDRYIKNFHYHGLGHVSQVYLGSHRHWHTIPSTTGTFWLHSRTLQTFFSQISKLRHYGIDPSVGESNTINQVYETVPCLSPLPGLAEHVMSVPSNIFVDWQTRWAELQNMSFS